MTTEKIGPPRGIDVGQPIDPVVQICGQAIDALNRALNGGDSSVWGESRRQCNEAIGNIAVLLEKHCREVAQRAAEASRFQGQVLGTFSRP